ncbi:hypothetical protein CPC08DRAFT_707135 [Agrocybe pediades]|nr:hypothetical protein CPC08DRAFT_707135 [Agrocybe pediades]
MALNDSKLRLHPQSPRDAEFMAPTITRYMESCASSMRLQMVYLVGLIASTHFRHGYVKVLCTFDNSPSMECGILFSR